MQEPAEKAMRSRISPPRNLVLATVLSAAILGLLISSPATAQSPIPPPELEYLDTWSVRIVPNHLAVNAEDGSLAVVDAGHGSIEILRRGGTHRTFREWFRDPRSAAFLPGGVLLVGEAGTGSVKGYDGQGNVVLTLGVGDGEFQTPNDIAVHAGADLIYVADTEAVAVKAYRMSDGQFEFEFGPPGQLVFPLSLAVNANLGEVYVGDSRLRRVLVFTANGAYLRRFGRSGRRDDNIGFMGGLHVDGDNRIYVVQTLGGFVSMYDPDGAYIGQIAEHGRGPGELRAPKAVVIDRYNRLLATSYLDPKIEIWGLDDFENPVDITMEARAIPGSINRGLPVFKVVMEPGGIVPEEEQIDPATLRINGTVEPIAESWRPEPHMLVRFPTWPMFETLPPDVSGEVVLTLSGETYSGNGFETTLPVVIVPDPKKAN